MVCGVLAKYSIMLMLRTITTPVMIKGSVLPTLYIACPYLVSRMVWKSRGYFSPTLDHCSVVIFRFYTAVFLSESTMPFTRVMLGSENKVAPPSRKANIS